MLESHQVGTSSLSLNISGESVVLDFENFNLKIVHYCISEIQERWNAIQRVRKANARPSAKRQTQRRNIPEEVDLCLKIAKYLSMYQAQAKNGAPGISENLDLIGEILEDDLKILQCRNQQVEIATALSNLRAQFGVAAVEYFKAA